VDPAQSFMQPQSGERQRWQGVVGQGAAHGRAITQRDLAGGANLPLGRTLDAPDIAHVLFNSFFAWRSASHKGRAASRR
jgi:hypothetical protein